MAIAKKKTIRERAERKIKWDAVGKLRNELYAKGYIQVEKAIANGFPLEAIALLDSMITDRLEFYFTKAYNVNRFAFLTLDKAITVLKGEKHAINKVMGTGNSIIISTPSSLMKLIPKLEEFRDQRNSSLHEVLKIEENKIEGWDRRYNEARKAAKNGIKILNQIKSITEKYKRGTLGS